LLADDGRRSSAGCHAKPSELRYAELRWPRRFEALRLLSSQHIIVTTRGVAGGSFVAHPSPNQISDTLATGVQLLLASQVVGVEELLEARACVEVPTARYAVFRLKG
jgi:DNA-binding FadR family transcriptional regulator